MSRLGPDRARRLAIGRAVMRARAAGRTWKEIVRWFAYGKTRLHAFMAEAEMETVVDLARAKSITFSVHEHLDAGHGPATRALSDG